MRKFLAILLTCFIFLNIGVISVFAAVASDCKEYCNDQYHVDDNPDGYTPPSDMVCMCNPLTATSTDALIDTVIDFIFWIGMAMGPLMIIIAGFLFMTAGGDTDKIKKAKNIITWTFIGLMIILLSRGLISAIKSVLG